MRQLVLEQKKSNSQFEYELLMAAVCGRMTTSFRVIWYGRVSVNSSHCWSSLKWYVHMGDLARRCCDVEFNRFTNCCACALFELIVPKIPLFTLKQGPSVAYSMGQSSADCRRGELPAAR